MIKTLRDAPHWFWLIGIAALMRLPTLGLEKLWFDETFTAWIARPGTNIWQAIIGDDHPPLWSLIQVLNQRLFGSSEFAFRLPAALLGIASVWLVWQIALELKIDRKTAFLAGILAALMPGPIYVSQDGRMYALFGFACLLALLAVMRAQWSIFSICGVILVYTQNAGVLYVFALGATALLIYRRKPAKPAWAIARIVLAWIPWLPVLLSQTQALKTTFWVEPLTPFNSLFPILQTTMGFRVPQSFQIISYGVGLGLCVVGVWASRHWLLCRYRFHVESIWDWPVSLKNAYIHGFLIKYPRPVQSYLAKWDLTSQKEESQLIDLGLETRIVHPRRAFYIPDKAALYLSMVLGGPFMMALVSIALGRSIYIFRPMIGSGMLLAILWAYALMHLAPDNRRFARVITVFAFAFALYGHWTDPRQDALAWVNPITSDYQPGDAVFFTQATSAILYGWYLPATIPQFVRPYPGDLLAITDADQDAFHLKRIALSDLAGMGYKRAFIVVSKTPLTRNDELTFLDQMSSSHPLTTLFREDTPGLGYEAIYETTLK